MSSSSDASLIASINNGIMQLNRYFAIFIFLFGMMGNISNIFVLYQPPLCSNPCAWLFLAASIANSIGILAGINSRFLSTWSADLTNTNPFLCKLRAFLLFDGITIAAWLIALATFDRWLSSNINANRRQQSTLKNAQRGTVLIVILSTIIQTQQIYCFEANLTNTPLKCYTSTVLCGIISDICFALITILFPLIFMLVFSLMTISNVRKIASRLRPTTITMNGHNGQDSATVSIRHRTQQKKTDRHLLIMLFIQVLLILVFTLPLAIYKLYSTISRNMPKSKLENAIENLIFNLFLLFLYVSCGMPFYIYTLSGGSAFRKALFALLETLRKKLMCRCG